jgi:tripartite-type tricarboxylate transporter receptor subunit TctC
LKFSIQKQIQGAWVNLIISNKIKKGEGLTMRKMRAIRFFLFTVVFALLLSVSAHAQQWPSEPVRIVVPHAAGGSSDVIARLIGPKLTNALGQPILVDSQPGAGTLIGTQFVARAAADGYTLLLADIPFTILPSVQPKVATYDPVKDFTPIAMIGTAAQCLFSSPSQFKSLAELMTAARSKPGTVTIASAGNGTTTHLMIEMLASSAGLKLVHVPYKGSAPAMADASFGHVQAAFSSYASGASFVNSGKLRVLAVTTPTRMPAMPDVPTFAESGLPELVVEHWWGIVGPAGLPKAIVKKLHDEIANAVGMPDVRERLTALHVEPRVITPEEFAKTIQAYSSRWTKVVKEANIKIE